MTTPLGQKSFEDKLEFWENQQPDFAVEVQQDLDKKHVEHGELDLFLSKTKELRKAIKFSRKMRFQPFTKKLNSCISSLQVLLKIILIGVVIGVIIFLVVNAVPIVQWVARFLTSIYDFFSDAIDWIVDLLITIYDWITDAINELVDGMKKVLDFVKNFPDEVAEMFEELFEMILSIF
jgi:ABC-type proline/glycine betaine transport system permease subunit